MFIIIVLLSQFTGSCLCSNLLLSLYEQVDKSKLENLTLLEITNLETNLFRIVDHNNKYQNSLFSMNINRFIYNNSIKIIENNKLHIGNNADNRVIIGDLITNSLNPFIESFDYREYNIISTPKDQLECGSCWAFAISSSAESIYALNTGILVELSPQQVLDCTEKINNCKGGYFDSIMNMFKKSWLSEHKIYPYTAAKNPCKNLKKVVDKPKFIYNGYAYIKKNDDIGLQQALLKYGPLPVSITITPKFMFYEKGIFDDIECENKAVNHAVVLVGYGISEGGTEYWVLKNSWGVDWGENGFFRIKKGNNFCGITDNAIVPFFNFIE